MASKIAVIFIAFITVQIVQSDPAWETLRVTWGPPQIQDPNNFQPLPTTEDAAQEEGYHLINEKCHSGSSVGFRYIKDRNYASIPIYDVNGFIAGLQLAIPKTIIKSDAIKYPFNTVGYYQSDVIDGEEVNTLTVYFIAIDKICSTGRSRREFDENVATDLHIQTGDNPSKFITIPRSESEMASTKWNKGGCFPSMGRHYWYNLYPEKDCNDFFPYFLMFNNGKLTGFGFANPGKYNYSKRFEYPTEPIIKNFMNPVPDCMSQFIADSRGFSTMHVYFNVRPENWNC